MKDYYPAMTYVIYVSASELVAEGDGKYCVKDFTLFYCLPTRLCPHGSLQ